MQFLIFCYLLFIIFNMELQQFIFLSLQIMCGGHSHTVVFCEMFPCFCYYPRSPKAWLSVLQMNINASSFSYSPIGTFAIPHIKGSAKTKVVILKVLAPCVVLRVTCCWCIWPARMPFHYLVRVWLSGENCTQKRYPSWRGLGGAFFPREGWINHVMCLYFVCNPSHEVRCRIFHWWHLVNAQKASDW